MPSSYSIVAVCGAMQDVAIYSYYARLAIGDHKFKFACFVGKVQ